MDQQALVQVDQVVHPVHQDHLVQELVVLVDHLVLLALLEQVVLVQVVQLE